ncbi:HAD hydrolase-like protein [Kordia algicida OT-1]|uniref:phosphoglycolate phosphatase n=1 Tax=Kordia algicida OT-1 TaxID=391587 RepID=A9DJU1_9FLAO|nr:HAD hydrolase-like protein [Kordia algicida]EDP98184.1 Haloacid dehalogenase-like hydrolase [Kordia algicida OT-1]
MMKKENLLVFDIDGTLLDSENIHQKGFVNALQKIGVEFVNTNWESYTHLTDSFIAKENYERDVNCAFSKELLTRFEAEFLKEIQNCNVTEIAGANAFLQKIIKETNYAVCFATGSMVLPAKLKLERAGIVYDQALLEASNDYFTREAIVNSAIAKAKNYFNVTHFKRIISLGDGIWDVKTAQNLGIEFIGIGAQNREKLAAQGAKHHYVNFEEFDMKLLK